MIRRMRIRDKFIAGPSAEDNLLRKETCRYPPGAKTYSRSIMSRSSRGKRKSVQLCSYRESYDEAFALNSCSNFTEAIVSIEEVYGQGVEGK